MNLRFILNNFVTEVNGGWSLYPVAYLPAASTMEMSFTSAQFNGDLFAMANNVDFTTGTVDDMTTGSYLVGEDNTVTITGVPATLTYSAFSVNGLTAAASDNSDTTPVTGKFEVANNDGTVTITFAAADNLAGKYVEITYTESKTASVIEVDNKKSAIGELILKYPKKKWAV